MMILGLIFGVVILRFWGIKNDIGMILGTMFGDVFVDIGMI